MHPLQHQSEAVGVGGGRYDASDRRNGWGESGGRSESQPEVRTVDGYGTQDIDSQEAKKAQFFNVMSCYSDPSDRLFILIALILALRKHVCNIGGSIVDWSGYILINVRDEMASIGIDWFADFW